jgi:DNA-binding NarL/FixJ family response regulator
MANIHGRREADREGGRGERDTAGNLSGRTPSGKSVVGRWASIADRLLERKPSIVLRLLDAIPVGIGVLLPNGHQLYQNAGLRELCRVEPQARRIGAAMRLTAHYAGTSDSGGAGWCTRDLRGAESRYRVTAFLVRSAGIHRQDVRLVLVERLMTASLDDAALRARYGLTTRELAVAHRLVEGESTKDIAAHFGVSIHTVRRHIEHIMGKLGVRTRLAGVRRLMETRG